MNIEKFCVLTIKNGERIEKKLIIIVLIEAHKRLRGKRSDEKKIVHNRHNCCGSGGLFVAASVQLPDQFGSDEGVQRNS